MSRVSPRAGGTRTRGAVEGFSVSASGSVELREGVPGRGDERFAALAAKEDLAGGGASLSIVNAMKSSCCNLRCCRMVSNTVDIVRRAK